MAAVISSSGTYPSVRDFSERSSKRFFYLVDVIGRHFTPTDSQLQALESSYRSTGSYMAESPEFGDLLEEIHAHGSRQHGTLVRPLDAIREGFDIDLIARLKAAAQRIYYGTDGPVRLLNDFEKVIRRYANAHGLRLHRWQRCITLEYAGGMTADIVPVIDDPAQFGLYGDTRAQIPDRETSRFDHTNPRGYAKWFNLAAAVRPNFTRTFEFSEAVVVAKRADIAPLPPAQEVFDRVLCRLVQLLKLHRNVAFAPTALASLSPSSIFVTTLAASAYTKLAPRPHDSPLELMLDIINDLPHHFQWSYGAGQTEHWVLDNPTAPGENLASGMNTRNKQDAFRQWAHKARADVTSILDAIEDNQGMDVLLQRLETAFGPRAAKAVRDDSAQQQQTSRSTGRTAIFTGIGMAAATSTRAHSFFGGK